MKFVGMDAPTGGEGRSLKKGAIFAEQVIDNEALHLAVAIRIGSAFPIKYKIFYWLVTVIGSKITYLPVASFLYSTNIPVKSLYKTMLGGEVHLTIR